MTDTNVILPLPRDKDFVNVTRNHDCPHYHRDGVVSILLQQSSIDRGHMQLSTIIEG